MKAFVLIFLFILAGCANRPTMEELEREALETGDWSAVKAREEALGRVNPQAGLSCPNGYVLLCEEMGPAAKCECVEPGGRRLAGGVKTPVRN